MAHQQNKKEEKVLDKEYLTDYDCCELYIRCVEVFVEIASRLDIGSYRCFELGQVLWEKTIEARDEYRESHPLK